MYTQLEREQNQTVTQLLYTHAHYSVVPANA